MENLIFPLIVKIVSLIIVVLAGFVLVRTGLLKKEDSLPLSKIAVYLLSPCVIISSFSVEMNTTVAKNLFLCFLYAILANFLFLFLGTLLRKVLYLNVVEEMSLEYTNCGNFVLPIVASVLGAEYLLYVSAYITVYNLLLWTHGLYLFQGKSVTGRESAYSFVKGILNPNLLAILFGLFLFITKLSLPTPIALAISDLGKMIGPFTMLITGIVLGGMPIKKLSSYKKIYLIAFLRLLAFPFFYLLLMKLCSMMFGFLNNPTLFLVTFLSAAAPTAANVTQLAILFRKEEEYASCINVFTTLLTVISIPVMVLISEKILT